MSEDMTADKINGLVERLRGIYRIPITDGLGATGGGEEPDNPVEFVRKFEPSKINLESASVITHLRDQLASANSRITELTAEVERQREALEPFVAPSVTMEQALWGSMPDEAAGTITVKLGDFRRARATLSHKEGK